MVAISYAEGIIVMIIVLAVMSLSLARPLAILFSRGVARFVARANSAGSGHAWACFRRGVIRCRRHSCGRSRLDRPVYTSITPNFLLSSEFTIAALKVALRSFALIAKVHFSEDSAVLTSSDSADSSAFAEKSASFSAVTPPLWADYIWRVHCD